MNLQCLKTRCARRLPVVIADATGHKPWHALFISSQKVKAAYLGKAAHTQFPGLPKKHHSALRAVQRAA